MRNRMFMRKLPLYFIFVSVVCIVSCRHNEKQVQTKNREIEIIDSCFLGMVDPFAYRYHTLRPFPGLIPMDTLSELRIMVYQNLTSLDEWRHSITSALKELKDSSLFNEYAELLHNNKDDSSEMNIDISKLKLTGKYRLIVTKKLYDSKDPGVIGYLQFSHVLYKLDKALIVTTIGANKSYIVRLFMLKRILNEWKVINDFVLEVS